MSFLEQPVALPRYYLRLPYCLPNMQLLPHCAVRRVHHLSFDINPEAPTGSQLPEPLPVTALANPLAPVPTARAANRENSAIPTVPPGRNEEPYHSRAAPWTITASSISRYDCTTSVAYSVRIREPRYAAVNGRRSGTSSPISVVRGPRSSASASIKKTEAKEKPDANFPGIRMATGRNTKMEMLNSTADPAMNSRNN